VRSRLGDDVMNCKLRCMVLLGSMQHPARCTKEAVRAFVRVRPLNTPLSGNPIAACEEHSKMYTQDTAQVAFEEVTMDEALAWSVHNE